MNDPVQIVCASNATYIMPLSVMLVSVVDNFQADRQLIIHIISNDASEQDKKNVADSIYGVRPTAGLIDIQWHSTNPQDWAELPDMGDSRLSRDTLVRILASEILPASCERVVWLDCDLVVLSDLGQLYDDTAGTNAVLHAVHDMGCPTISYTGGVFDYAERNIPPDSPYFNAGFLVMNLREWRKRDLTKPIFEYLKQNIDRLHFFEQDAMNAILHADWKPLDFRWNQLPSILYEKSWTDAGYTREDWLRAKKDPSVVHYLGPKKPWVAGWRHAPRRVFFFRYLQKTVFKNTVPRFPYLETIMGFPAYYELWRIGDKMFPQGFRFSRRVHGVPAPKAQATSLI